jgi:hypothetical protein
MLKVFQNVLSNDIAYEFSTPNEVFNFIKGNRPDLEKIKKLRQLDKGDKNTIKIKQSLPAILWNFDSSGGRNADSLTNSTGLIYIDIDKVEDKDIDYKFNNNYFYSYWKSVSENGYGALIKVSGVTTENFKEAYKMIADTLKIPYDKSTVKPTQLNILSYDPNIVINPDSEIFNCNHLSSDLENMYNEEKKEQSISKNELIKNSIWTTTFSKLRYDNLEEKCSTIDFVYDENGLCDLGDNKIHYTSIVLSKKFSQGKRHAALQKVIIQLITLNPQITLDQLSKMAWAINKEKCQPPKSLNEVNSLCKSCLKNKVSFVLIPNKTRRFFFKDNSLSKEQKISLIRSYLNKENAKVNQTKIMSKIKELFEKGKPFKLKTLMMITNIKTSKTLIAHLKKLKHHFQPEEWKLILTNAKI